jgi:hypothetical protein
MLKAAAIASAGVLLTGVVLAIAEPSPSPAHSTQLAQAQDRTAAEYQKRLMEAKTPEERARIQAEHERMMQQGAVPDSGGPTRQEPAMPGSRNMQNRQDFGLPIQPGPSGSAPSGKGGGRY